MGNFLDIFFIHILSYLYLTTLLLVSTGSVVFGLVEKKHSRSKKLMTKFNHPDVISIIFLMNPYTFKIPCTRILPSKSVKIFH